MILNVAFFVLKIINMTKWHGGKGSSVKPYDKEKFNENFDKIFGNKKKGDKKDANKTKGKSKSKK